MNSWVLISIIIIGSYLVLMTLFIVGWVRLILSSIKNPQLKEFTVVIPYRNEKERLQGLIDALMQLDYPKQKVEFIFVNDHSEDGSEVDLLELLKNFQWNFRSLENVGNGKKRAIQLAVENGSYEHIITLDADCVVSPDWLKAMSLAEADLVIGPVIANKGKGFLKKMQEIELMMLSGIAMSAVKMKIPVLCSGANLSYRKKAFQELDPYSDNLDILSGDDMFLLKKMMGDKRKVEAVSHSAAVVKTETADSFKELINKARRWSGKSGKVNLPLTNTVGMIVVLANLISLILPVVYLLNSSIGQIFWILPVSKFVFDFLFLFLMVRRYGRSELIWFTPIMAMTYPIYLMIVVFASVSSSNNWKGRKL